MHQYLKSIGFGNIRDKKQLIQIIRDVEESYTGHQLVTQDEVTDLCEFDKEYENALSQFDIDWNTWKEHKKAWEADRQKRYETARAERIHERDVLRQMFDDFGKFPKQYRFESCVAYVHEVLSSSDVNISTAIEMYDRERQRQLESERIDVLNRQADLQAQRNRELEYQSELQDRANDIAERHRREAVALGAYNAYQNHKQTKILEKREKERQRAIKRAKRGY